MQQQQQLPRSDPQLLSVRPRKFWHGSKIMLGKRVSTGRDGLKLVRRDPPQIVCSLKKKTLYLRALRLVTCRDHRR